MKNTADVAGGKPIAVLLQSISDVSAINPLVAFYDIHGGKRSYSLILSRTPNETALNLLVISFSDVYLRCLYSGIKRERYVLVYMNKNSRNKNSAKVKSRNFSNDKG
jgi:hypothetical protein